MQAPYDRGVPGPPPPPTRPRVGLSACLLGERVRHDGAHKRAEGLLRHLGPHVEWVPVCPEVELGLGVPREPIALEADPAGGAPRLLACRSRTDLTLRMDAYARARIASLAGLGLRGYVLKSRSPSCARGDAPVAGLPQPAPGAFARRLLELLPGLVVADEAELEAPAGRERYLAALRARPPVGS